jgi:hypothetical protein
MVYEVLTSRINSTCVLPLLIMQAEPHVSWLHELVFPLVFTVAGAGIGFFASQIRDDQNAKRAKISFLRAVGMELAELSVQLADLLQNVRDSSARVTDGGTGPHFAIAFQTSVFTSQIGKLRDLDDPLLLDAVRFYSELGSLQQFLEAITDQGDEYNRAPVTSIARDSARSLLARQLNLLQATVAAVGTGLRVLRAKLPHGEQPK